MTRLRLTTHPLHVRTVPVRSVERVSPRMLRVVLGGEQLGSFVAETPAGPVPVPAFRAPGFDDHVKLVFAEDGDLRAALPRQLAEGIEWTEAPNRLTRDYTPRWVDEKKQEFALDFVLHGHGPAASWARGARPGDLLAFVGPKSSMSLPDDHDAVLLIGDETALPAIGRFLDERPTAAPAHIVVVLGEDSGRQDLEPKLGPADTLEWVLAPEDPAQAGAALLAAARTAWDRAREVARPSTPFVWAAGDASDLLPLRRWVKQEIGPDKSHQSITGYWHHDEEDAAASHGPALPESPARWIAVSAAVNSGLLVALADAGAEGTTTAGVSDRLNRAPEATEALLRVLERTGAVAASATSVDGDLHWTLTPRGWELVEDEHAREAFEAPALADLRALLSWSDAYAADGEDDHGAGTGWHDAHGGTYAEVLTSHEDLREPILDRAEALPFLAHAIRAGLPNFGAQEDPARPVGTENPPAATGQKPVPGPVLLVGLGAESLHGILAEDGSPDPVLGAEFLVRAEPGAPLARTDGTTGWAAVVSALELCTMTDGEAEARLRELRGTGAETWVLDAPRPDELSPIAAELDLLSLARIGRTRRTHEDVAGLAERTGWSGVESRDVGWGMALHRLLPADPTGPADAERPGEADRR